MEMKSKKISLGISVLLTLTGIVILFIGAYFLIQSLREYHYQSSFEKKYEFIPIKNDHHVQVFHGVKINTFLKEENRNNLNSTIILEIKDEIEAEIKASPVDTDTDSMKAYSDVIQYKHMVNRETNEETFIIAMQTTPAGKRVDTKQYRTYSINENGVITKSEFTIGHQSKAETQWIRGISKQKHGYYTDLPYQDGAWTSLLLLIGFGLLSLFSGIKLGQNAFNRYSGAAV
ncbi:hypothetical protein LCL96_18335 [Rossellomorea aquimaris]|uniref:hypothetical protein n=1 Tax=Rossellomorea aquimaris TaxID=189382 RepID=UPI001CD5F180|nr:hypothetical protein [Rossellomorea aquimaris]MCA1060877.1 hypothetical protein [Rossellomorea aquimaris]